MSEEISKNRRIAKNTLMLYFRLLITIGVTLYMSRVLLSALGVEDYGIYNVVGGVVAMFSMISVSLSSAISRFITFELGRENQGRLNDIFSTSIIIQLLIAVIIAILVESVGVWFLENRMVIPADRLVAARWVLHFSLLALMVKIISVPFNATIIAHEHMSAFAYISIIEVTLTLMIALMISMAEVGERLMIYAMLIFCASVVTQIIYALYCRYHFAEARFRLFFDRALLCEMFGFAGWNFIGSSSAILRDQGGNIILNIFAGGPVVNAARGVSMQVNGAIMAFSSNFMMAVNPQITKSYAAGDRDYMMTLIFQGSRLSFYLLLLLSMPIIISAPYVLTLWLNIVPEYTVEFVRLALIFGMCESISFPLTTAMLATGRIKNYQILVGGLQMMNLPVAYVLLRLGAAPTVVPIVAIAISVCCLVARLYMLQRAITLPAMVFMRRVVANIVVVSALSVVVPYFARGEFDDNFLGFVVCSLICVVSTLCAIYVVGCNTKEREFVNSQIKRWF